MRILVFIAILLFVSCRSSRKTIVCEKELRSFNDVKQSDSSSVFKTKLITAISSEEKDIELVHVEYDTSVRDSCGLHPIKSETRAVIRKKENSKEQTEEKIDSLHISDVVSSDSVYVSDNTVLNEEKEGVDISQVILNMALNLSGSILILIFLLLVLKFLK